MKKLLAIALSCAVLSVNAGIIDDLKKEPVSQYELGNLKLSLSAYFATQSQAGTRIGNFTFKKMDVIDDETLGFRISYLGESKYLSNESCRDLNDATKKLYKSDPKFIRSTWSNLSENQYLELERIFVFSTELISKENPNLKITC